MLRFLFRFKLVFVSCLFIFIGSQLIGQQDVDERGVNSITNSWKKNGSLNAYGVVNYYNFDWDTDPDRRAAFDAERLNIYLDYKFSEKIEFKSEIEFEHGGTGATMSFDVLEEFGEFEQEIETGGAVNLEQINLLFKINKWLNIRLGKMRIYTALASELDDPTEYFTTHRSELENTIQPLGWYEHGIEFSGDINSKLDYKLYIINGLDATGFSSATWIRNGYQKRFETVNANNFALVGRLDYKFSETSEIGFSAYFGNSSGNRPKNDTDIPAYVGLYDIHLRIDQGPLRVRALGMYGTLSNSEAISKLNRNLSNNLDVKRTPVAAASLGAFVEVAYDVFSFNFFDIKNKQLYLFSRLEYYDSMFRTQGEIFDNPRWERQVFVGGLNYYPHKQVVLKTQYSWRSLGSGEKENTFSTGIGFKF